MSTIWDVGGLRNVSLEVRGIFFNGVVYWRQLSVVVTGTSLIHDGISKMEDAGTNGLVLGDLHVVKGAVGIEDYCTVALFFSLSSLFHSLSLLSLSLSTSIDISWGVSSAE